MSKRVTRVRLKQWCVSKATSLPVCDKELFDRNFTYPTRKGAQDVFTVYSNVVCEAKATSRYNPEAEICA